MGAHLYIERAIDLIGRDELTRICGVGAFNVPEGRTLDEVRLADAIAHANRIVAGYVRGRYAANVSTPTLQAAAADIVRYRLRSDMGEDTISEEVRRRHADALAYLKDVQAGRATLLGTDDEPLGEADGPSGSVMVSRARPERAGPALEGYL